MRDRDETQAAKKRCIYLRYRREFAGCRREEERAKLGFGDSIARFFFAGSDCDLDLSLYEMPLFIVDREGWEAQIKTMPEKDRRKSMFLIETHDLFAPGITGELVDLLNPTHEVETIKQRRRNSQNYRELDGLHEFDRFSLPSEIRSHEIHWIFAEPKLNSDQGLLLSGG